MLVTTFLSMWMSNTATAVMMLPIALSVIKIVTDRDPNNNQFGKAMLLAIAYGASIGGIATLIGTPPNALMAAYLSDSYNIEIGFGQWVMLGLPLSIVLLVFTWLWLTKFSYKVDQAGEVSSKSVFKDQLDKLGAMSAGEKKVLFIFAFAALGWIFRPYIAKATGIGLSDTGVAMMAAILLFALPVKSGSNQGAILPPLDEIQAISKHIAFAVGKQAIEEGLALPLSEAALNHAIETTFWQPQYRHYRRTSF
ncbi:SLC13 family permease [Vibrio sp. MarTm2]|uniref:SLC13 family permease n=1 Tax=Vibrio sp. MarTm2 TaxID=2998831 RepID=UPI0022CD48B1|nr:SLC13 family permease [Vibrio sp. MarTm2]MDA0127557.1 SLC13 family permease [Vibrio sp. MarTm2]